MVPAPPTYPPDAQAAEAGPHAGTDARAEARTDTDAGQHDQGGHVLPPPPPYKKRKRLLHTGSATRQVMSTSELRYLIGDLEHATRERPNGDLRRATDQQLQRASDPDLLSILSSQLPYATENMVLKALTDLPRSEDETLRLAQCLHDRGFLLHAAPRPPDPALSEEHSRRRVKVACWLLSWLLEPLAARDPDTAGRIVRDLAAAEEGSAERDLLDDLLVYRPPDHLPELPGTVWQQAVRALRDRAG
jgi:hypothetical protein